MTAPARSFRARRRPIVRVLESNRSAGYAAEWLRRLGVVEVLTGPGGPDVDVAVVGCRSAQDAGGRDVRRLIRLWDFQVGHAGSGHLASAASGAAAAIGEAGGAPVALPAEFPEKWCGAYGAILALAEIWRRLAAEKDDGAGEPTIYDVSAADVLRAFALQNAGDRQEMTKSWRRNGRLAVEHGGIYPQGFYACRDGYVALLGRSRRDWRNILKAVGDPSWAKDPAFADPFALARDSGRADVLLQRTLHGFSRDELLRRGLAEEAVIAPVYSLAEAAARDVFRAGFMAPGGPAMPMQIEPLPAGTAAGQSAGEAEGAIGGRGQPLAGLRCIELAWVWSGPLVGQILGDLGAEVVKVEWRSRFDLYRTRGVEHLRGVLPEAVRRESSLYFHSLNRNKLGMTLDLKHAEGGRTLRLLAARSQILIENFTAGTLERLGLGPAELGAANGALVVLSMSGPGRGSRLEALRSYGLVLSALGGAEALVERDGAFLGSPTFSLSDPNAALFGAMAALAGAICARLDGQGLVIDLSQIEAAATLAGAGLAQPPETGERRILAGGDGRYVASEAAGGRTTAVLELDETDAAPIFAQCDAWLPSNHPVTGEERLVAAPWRIDGRRPPLRKLAPTMGESNDRVLRRILALSNEEIDALLESGAL